MTSLHRPRLAALGLVAGLALLASTAPAVAESYTQIDATRDVVTYSFDAEQVTTADDPANRATDIRRVTYDFRDRKLVVRATLREVAPRTRAFVQVRAAGSNHYLFSTRSGGLEVETDDGSDEGCRGGLVAARPASGTIRVVIPAPCIGDPASARVGFAVTRSVGLGSDAGTISVDDAGRTGFPENADNLKLGKRIQRG